MYDKTDPLMVALPIGEIIQSCIHGKNYPALPTVRTQYVFFSFFFYLNDS